jgi:hypothetical protein
MQMIAVRSLLADFKRSWISFNSLLRPSNSRRDAGGSTGTTKLRLDELPGLAPPPAGRRDQGIRRRLQTRAASAPTAQPATTTETDQSRAVWFTTRATIVAATATMAVNTESNADRAYCGPETGLRFTSAPHELWPKTALSSPSIPALGRPHKCSASNHTQFGGFDNRNFRKRRRCQACWTRLDRKRPVMPRCHNRSSGHQSLMIASARILPLRQLSRTGPACRG